MRPIITSRMFSFYSSPRIWSPKYADFLPVGSFKFYLLSVGFLTWGDEGCQWGLLAAGPLGPAGGPLVSWEPGKAVGRGLFCSRRAGAQTSPLEHCVCGYPGNGEEPLQMCCEDRKPFLLSLPEMIFNPYQGDTEHHSWITSVYI